MKSPHKIRRIQRQFTQGQGAEPINIVSLIDIFAILVFYLLVSVAAVELRPDQQAVELPRSTSEQRPRETAQLMVTRQHVLLNNHVIMTTPEALANADAFLPTLRSALLANVGVQTATASGVPGRGEISILANKDIPYSLLKKLMATCTEAQFARISLAVLKQDESQP